MRIIPADHITETVRDMCINANCLLPEDVQQALCQACKTEQSPTGRDILDKILQNADIAREKYMPICQDTGMAVFFVEIGQDVHVEGNLTDAINEGVRRGYSDGYLRKSIVSDPLERKNTGDNTPAVIHYSFIQGDKIALTLAPKGFGSENMSAVHMFSPSEGVEAIKQFVVDTVDKAGANPCPPIVVGVGIGGNLEKCACLAKHALTQTKPNPNPYYAEMEQELLDRINQLGIGPQGFGGTNTALAVHIETFPTHIAGLPAAVNINCHVTRHVTEII
ncbi:MAG: fumarate hydratase [Ruminococcaceae bacterium]|nr:fumarate hydratase [Oscillospiraceae bacterium]